MSEVTGMEFRAFEHTEQLNEFGAAMAKAQGTICNAKKDTDNAFFKSKYADLASVWEACRASLSANGIAVVQMPGLTPRGDLEVTTQLIHASGQWMRSTISAKPAKCDPQGVGSAATYLRRYGLSAMVGVAPEEDDGEGAAGRGQPANGQSEIAAPSGKARTAANGPKTAAPVQSEADAAFRDLANEILKAIKACDSSEAVNTLLKVRADDLESIKAKSQTAYDALIENALKRDAVLANHTALSAA